MLDGSSITLRSREAGGTIKLAHITCHIDVAWKSGLHKKPLWLTPQVVDSTWCSLRPFLIIQSIITNFLSFDHGKNPFTTSVIMSGYSLKDRSHFSSRRTFLYSLSNMSSGRKSLVVEKKIAKERFLEYRRISMILIFKYRFIVVFYIKSVMVVQL